MNTKSDKKRYAHLPAILILTFSLGVAGFFFNQLYQGATGGDTPAAEEPSNRSSRQTGRIRFGKRTLPHSYEKFTDETGAETFRTMRDGQVVCEIESQDAGLAAEDSEIERAVRQINNSSEKSTQIDLEALDLSGDGTPFLVFTEGSGGRYGPVTYRLINLRSKRCATHQLEDSPQIEISTPDEGGKVRLSTHDWALARGREGVATGYTTFEIHLNFKNGNFAFSPELNRRALNPHSVRRAEELSQRLINGEDVLTNFFNEIFELIYRGEGRRALAILQKTYEAAPENSQVAEMFDFLLTELKDSQFWADIEMLNGWHTAAGQEELAKYELGC